MSLAAEPYVSSRNACKLCTPFGAALAFLGVEGCVPLLHGSQGCSTYIRRYLIGHFREPVDIASSNFGEQAAVFGGRDNLFRAMENIRDSYHPKVIGIATTCLAETIGDDVRRYVDEWDIAHRGDDGPAVVQVSTASYRGTHADGYWAAVDALVRRFADIGPGNRTLNIFPGMVSPEDIRYLRRVVTDYGLNCALLPDYADTLDGPAWREYHLIPPGGTALKEISSMTGAIGSILLSAVQQYGEAGRYLEAMHDIPLHACPAPCGVRLADRFHGLISERTGRAMPERSRQERGRLLDAMVDGHKYVFEKRAMVYGDIDLVLPLVSFLCEIGITPVIVGTGEKNRGLRDLIGRYVPECGQIDVREGVDFAGLEEAADTMELDVIIGNSNGYKLARKYGVPLVRIGMPVHDRLGAGRQRMLDYDGSLMLYDRIVNTFIEQQQDCSPFGYSHM